MTQEIEAPLGTTTTNSPGGLAAPELYWRDRQPWLQERGYMLRSRYKPDWVPSWQGTKKTFFECEDGHVLEVRTQFSIRAFG